MVTMEQQEEWMREAIMKEHYRTFNEVVLDSVMAILALGILAFWVYSVGQNLLYIAH